jgi:uncharacterized protein YukE
VNGPELTKNVNGHLDYVSQLAGQLGMTDPVESFLTPTIGTWNDLRDEAGRWRAAAATAEQVNTSLTGPLGGLDAAWQGADATSFLAYMQKIGAAGTDLSDAMTAMADALDKTADGLQQIVSEMVDLLTDTAEQTSDAMSVPVNGETRVRQLLDELHQPTSQLYESVRDVLDAFVRMCEGTAAAGSSGASAGQVAMAHTMPAGAWKPSSAAGSPAAGGQPADPVLSGQLPLPGQPAGVPGSGSGAVPGQPVSQPVSQPVAQPAAQPLQPAAAAAPAAAAPVGAPAQPAPAVASAQPAPVGAGHAGGTETAASGTAAGHQVAAPHAGGAGDPGAAAAPAPPAPQQMGQGGSSGASADLQQAPEPAAAGTPAAAGAQQDASSGGGGMGGGMMGMGGMSRGGQGGGDQEHKTKIRTAGDVREIFGRPGKTAPPVIGEE